MWQRHLSTFFPEVLLGFQKFYQLLSPIFEKPINEAIMREIIWTEEEMCNRMKDVERGSGLPFWKVLVARVSKSDAGQFISEFSGGFPADQQLRELKLNATKKTLREAENVDEYERMNNIVDDMFGLITKIIQTEGDKAINFKTFLGYLEMLRLSDSKIGSLDKHLIQLNTLKVLVLSGNVIEKLRFDYLPPSLRVLELNNNLISQIKVDHKIAAKLLYLGLSSNCLSDESLMEGLPFLDKLSVFDLSDNNFSDFRKVFEIIRQCPYLECICLKGNPLSTVASYKEIIRESSPKLRQLDGVSLSYETEKESRRRVNYKEQTRKGAMKKDKEKKVATPLHNSSFCYTAELRIHVFRMVGIPKPFVKNKKFKGYFQFEVQLPLLDQRNKVKKKCNAMFELLRQSGFLPKASDYPPPVDSLDGTNQKAHEHKPPKPESRNRNRRYSEKGKKKEPWETEYEEFLANDQQMPDACSILSEKIRWAPIIKPNGPIAVISVNSANLGQLRYTLKSIIVIRLYFNHEGSRDDSSIGKRLVAKISVPAQEPHWREEFCSYEWNAKQPQIAMFHPTIGNLKFQSGPRGRQKSKFSIGCGVPTCHLGIALHRIS